MENRENNWCGAALEYVLLNSNKDKLEGDAKNVFQYLKNKKEKHKVNNGRYVKNPFCSENTSVHKVYAYTNELVDEAIDCLDLTGKSVLTVGSSGDQLLTSILHGASHVTLADINPMAKYFTALKIAAIKNLDLSHFQLYFNFYNIFDHKLYAKVSHDLDEESRTFWDYLISNNAGNSETNCMFQYLSFQDSVNVRYINDEKKYNQLRQKLNEVTIDFATFDFNDFYKLNRKYDVVLLSNIYDYIQSYRFVNGIKNIAKNILNDNGSIQLYYDLCYDNSYTGSVLAKEVKKCIGKGKCIKYKICRQIGHNYQFIYYNGEIPTRNSKNGFVMGSD